MKKKNLDKPKIIFEHTNDYLDQEILVEEFTSLFLDLISQKNIENEENSNKKMPKTGDSHVPIK